MPLDDDDTRGPIPRDLKDTKLLFEVIRVVENILGVKAELIQVANTITSVWRWVFASCSIDVVFEFPWVFVTTHADRGYTQYMIRRNTSDESLRVVSNDRRVDDGIKYIWTRDEAMDALVKFVEINR